MAGQGSSLKCIYHWEAFIIKKTRKYIDLLPRHCTAGSKGEVWALYYFSWGLAVQGCHCPGPGNKKGNLIVLPASKQAGNQWRSAVSPHIAKSYFETYKIYDHLQKIRCLSQKFTDILRFENFEITIFCHTLAYENRRNSLNFWDTRLTFWI